MDRFVAVTEKVKLHVRHRPGVQPRAFLLVHGLTSNARLWDEVADRLATRGHPVYAVDLRGHGESDAPDDGHDTETAASDLATVTRTLGLSGLVVAGHSWGASVALRLTAENSGLVAGLALVDGGWVDFAGAVGTWERGAGFAAALQQNKLGGFTTIAQLRGYLRAVHPGWSDAAIEAFLTEMHVGPDGVVAPRLPAAHHTSIIRSLWEEPPDRWYPAIKIPVMMLPALPPSSPQWQRDQRGWVEKAEQALPQATTRWYEGADHNLHAEHPDRLAADLLDLAAQSAQVT
jgi:pimeloyl-ACP methyl ester carboxylesterase